MLKKYNDKRDFSRTREPKGKEKNPGGQDLAFMIHKHHARRLHYDLRLELDGVLKSWAVPKGPSNDPEVKRLAIMVEDHPYDYKDFEGVIPDGEYGAGPTLIWDAGTYIPEEDQNDKKANEECLRAGLRKGYLKFVLFGKKLHGAYSLVHISSDKDNTWLLVKSDDRYAREAIPDEELSVVSGKTIEELRDSASSHLNPSPKKRGEENNWEMTQESILKEMLRKAKKWALPKDIKPMLATLLDSPFDKKDWIFEVKWDGYRTIAEVEKGKVRLYSRNGLPFNAYFPDIARELKDYPDIVFDGEVIAFENPERPHADFWSLQNYIKTGEGTLAYYIFDILYYDGYLLSGLPLIERKSILQNIIKTTPHIWFSSHIWEFGKDFFDIAKKEGLEGIIGKDANSPYLFWERSPYWVKIKNLLTEEAIICGYTEPRGSRKWFGALILGIYKWKGLRYIGHTGWGFDEASIQETKELLDKYKTDKCPFEEKPKTNTKPTWVLPKIVCEVRFQEWTQDGVMRQPVFLGIREDKKPEEIAQEKEERMSVISEKEIPKKPIAQYDRKIVFSNRGKVYFPEDHITKGELIEYYECMSSYILPYLINRPESLLRYPDGIESEGFYQKNMSMDDLPSWFETEPIESDSEKKVVNYPVVRNTESLLYLINLGCIDLHPWSSRVGSLEYPDYIIFDFDPEDIRFSEVVKAAQITHDLLDSLGVPSVCKTSGATGLHILVPTGARYTYEQATGFARLINTVVNSRLPKTTSIERLPKNRQKKVYLDFLQNRQGQTIASAYSIRPRKGAPVSTPILWEELNNTLNPEAFNMRTIFDRLQKLGDIWRGAFDQSFDMEKSIENLEGILKK